MDPGRIVTTPLQDSGYAEKSDPSAVGVPASMIPDQVYFIPQNGSQREYSRNLARHGEFVFSKQPMSNELPLATFVQPKQSTPLPSCAYSSKAGSSRELDERKEGPPMKSSAPPALQYVNSGPKPVHFVLPVSQSFIQSGHKNIVISTALPGVSQTQCKNVLRPIFTSQFSSQSSPSSPNPMAQMGIPNAKAQEGLPSQNPVMYQNLMVFNPFANTLYPQPTGAPEEQSTTRCYSNATLDTTILKSTCSKAPHCRITQHSEHSSVVHVQNLQSVGLEVNNSLDELPSVSDEHLLSNATHMEEVIHNSEIMLDQGDSTNDNSSKSDRVKILSNVKVELPIQHIPDIIDLTSAGDQQKKTCPDITTPGLNQDESILPDFVDAELCHSYSQNRFSVRTSFPNKSIINNSCIEISQPLLQEEVQPKQPTTVNTFSVIKNIGNPNNLYKENMPQNEDPKMEDNCAIPDLTCNEKPSISPCSDLTNDSNEGIYERLCTLSNTASTSTKLPPVQQSRFPISSMTTARKNLFVKKPKKVISIKSKSNSNSLDNPSSSKNFSLEISKVTDPDDGVSQISKKSSDSIPEEIGRLDGFFKELDKQKKVSAEDIDIDAPSESWEKSTLPAECGSLDISVDEDSRSCDNDVDMKEQSMDIDTDCIVRTYNNDFRNCILEKTDSLKGVDDNCTLGAERLMESASQKNFTELETMRPVNVIAFGSILASNAPSESSTNTTFIDVEKSSTVDYSTTTKEKQELDSLIRESYLRENVYTEYFSAHKESYSHGETEEQAESNSEQKVEVCTVDEEEEEKKQEYISWETQQKEEYGFSNFMDCNYEQGMYQKLEDAKETKALERAEVDQRSQFSSADACGGEHNDYAELICPRDSYLEQDHKGAFLAAMGSGGVDTGNEVDALNIRTDERMPPRGELSEQESSGDTPWAGVSQQHALHHKFI